MRIISGLYKGRKLEGDNIDGTRPTMDRIKESFFAMIQDHLKNSVVLDLFAGSGSLGLEALSSGASFSYFNDHNQKCIKVINNNIKTLNLESNTRVLNLDYEEALNYFQKNNIKFNIVFLDPPYKDRNINTIIDYLIDYNLLLEKALIVIEVGNDYIDNEKIKVYKKRVYGDKQIIILQI